MRPQHAEPRLVKTSSVLRALHLAIFFMLQLGAAPSTKPKPCCVVFSLQYGVKLCWPGGVGETRSKPKSHPKRH